MVMLQLPKLATGVRFPLGALVLARFPASSNSTSQRCRPWHLDHQLTAVDPRRMRSRCIQVVDGTRASRLSSIAVTNPWTSPASMASENAFMANE